MARRYTRDARGRFASGGFSGQTGGRGARLMSGGRSRAGGGATIKAAPTGGRLPGVVPKTPSGGRAAAATRRKNYLGRTSQRPDPVKVREQASKPRSEPLTTGGGTLAARGSLKRSRAKLRENDTPSQRGAVTRASRYTGMAIKRERASLGQSVQGRFVRGKGRSATAPTAAPANRPERGTLAARRRLGQARSDAAASFNPGTARRLTTANREAAGAMRTSRQRLGQSPAGRLVRVKGRQGGPANNVRRTGPEPLIRRANNIKPYRPNTVDGRMNQIDRQIDRTMKPLVDDLRNIGNKLQKARPQIDAIGRQLERMNAKDIADRNKKGIKGEVSREVLAITGTKAGRKAITRRMQRALDAAGRGSKVGQRAVRVYLNQLAGMGPGKPSKGRNNLRPGPRNTKGTPKRRRKR